MGFTASGGDATEDDQFDEQDAVVGRQPDDLEVFLVTVDLNL